MILSVLCSISVLCEYLRPEFVTKSAEQVCEVAYCTYCYPFVNSLAVFPKRVAPNKLRKRENEVIMWHSDEFDMQVLSYWQMTKILPCCR